MCLFFSVPMGKDKKKEENKVVTVEFRVSMHCNACERSVAKVISKIKGVEKFMTDMTHHKVVVTGRINPQKVLKKLRKKTGKRVEMVVKSDDAKEAKKEGEIAEKVISEPVRDYLLWDCCADSELLTMFSDENANACSVM